MKFVGLLNCGHFYDIMLFLRRCMMRNANKVWFVCAIMVCALAIVATAYAAYRLVGFEVSKPEGQALPNKALRDLQKSDKASVSVVSLQIPPAIAPQVYSLAAGVGAGEKDIGFILYWDPGVYENADKLGREVAAIGISGGDYQGTVILQSPKGAVVASPRGLFTPDPPLWQGNFSMAYDVVKEAFDALESRKSRLTTDESFKIDFRKRPTNNDELPNSEYMIINFAPVGQNWEPKNNDESAKDAKMIAAVFNKTGEKAEKRIFLGSSIHSKEGYTVILWGYGNKSYELSFDGLIKYDAHIDNVTKTIYASPMLPFAPPLLHLAILCGIFAVLLLAFFLGKYHDFALSSFSAFLAIVLAGGASLLLDGRIAPEIVPLACLIGAGIIWTVPVLFFSISFGLDLATGWYWLFFALLAAASVASKILPSKWTWIGLEILLGVIALAILALLAMKSRKKPTV